ncbi:bacteriohemerythrin, partial [Bacteroides caecimuris]|uniref:bacteriohemerythrin n=1 Tax=Bacteroides caecimuris TaxID=1796613 RepID=UPI00265D1BFB
METMSEIKWNDRFNLGVDEIDKAHQKLFSIVNKLIAFTENPAKQQHACKEGIKYFKSYTIKHFAEEEAYMQSIAYAGLPMHKSLHDHLRDKTLPALEAELDDQNYSIESVQHFIGICVGWLTGHIMVEDRAITGRNANKWVHTSSDDKMESIIKATTQGLKSMSRAPIQLVSQHYGGEGFKVGKPLCYRLTYSHKSEQKQQIHLVFEESVAILTLNNILDMDI